MEKSTYREYSKVRVRGRSRHQKCCSELQGLARLEPEQNSVKDKLKLDQAGACTCPWSCRLRLRLSTLSRPFSSTKADQRELGTRLPKFVPAEVAPVS